MIVNITKRNINHEKQNSILLMHRLHLFTNTYHGISYNVCRGLGGDMGNFVTGPLHIFNPVPTNEEESLQHGNALAASGNYPVGTSECFNVGISGGCGKGCFVYKKGECDEPMEIE